MKEETIFDDILIATSKDDEISLLRRLVAKQPTNAVACLRLGNLLREKGDYNSALKLHRSLLIRSGVKLNVKNKVCMDIVKDYVKAGNTKLVLSSARELQRLASKDIPTLEFLSSIYEELSQWEEAISVKERILKLTNKSNDREIAILTAFFGDSLIKKGDKREGVKRLQQALKLDKLCLPGLLFMGDFYYESGDIDKGIKFWERVLNNLPDYAFLVFSKLKKAYYEAKHDFSRIEALYTSFLDRNPNNVRALIDFSEIYEKKGEDEDAIATLERAEEIDPKNVIVKKKLFKLYYDNKRYKDMFKAGNKIADLTSYKDFNCHKCGREFDSFSFRCPNCKNWLTIR